MTPENFIQWLDEMISKTENWKGSGMDFHMQRSTQIAVLKQVKGKFLSIKPSQGTFHNPDNPEPENNFTDGLE